MVKEKELKRMYAVERLDVMDNHSTYEIFPSLKKALDFAVKLKTWKGVHIPLYVFRAYFNKDRIFFEDGSWNYEDFSDTVISKTEILAEFNDPKDDGFEINDELWKQIETIDNEDGIKSLFNFPSNSKKIRRSIWRNSHHTQ